MNKFMTVGLILFLSAWLMSYVYDKLTLRLDFNKVFNSSVAPAPNREEMLFELVGNDGDSVIVGHNIQDDGTLVDVLAEELNMTPKTIDELRGDLNSLDLEKWEILTKIPAPLLRFNAKLKSHASSPNNSKKISYFITTLDQDNVKKINPNEVLTISKNFSLEMLTTILPKINMKMYYKNGLYHAFYDENGNFVSQATGDITIAPTWQTSFYLFIGSWVFIIGLLVLIKETFTMHKDFIEIANYFKD